MSGVRLVTYWDVHCTYCLAWPGRPCRNADGTRYWRRGAPGFHNERKAAAFVASREAPIIWPNR